jgi:DNA-binding NarL/FixJ family response regulator
VDRFTGVSEVSNVAIIQRCLLSFPRLRWIVWSSQPSTVYRAAAKSAGAIGYFDVPMTSDQLQSAVEWADAGRPIGWTTSSAPMTESTRGPDAADNSQVAQAPAAIPGVTLPQQVWQLDAGHGPQRLNADLDVASSKDKPVSAIADANLSADEALPTGPKLEDLSQREREVLQGLAAGRTNQQIADELYLSVKTIETYRSRLKQKLGMWHRSEMVAFFHSLV